MEKEKIVTMNMRRGDDNREENTTEKFRYIIFFLPKASQRIVKSIFYTQKRKEEKKPFSILITATTCINNRQNSTIFLLLFFQPLHFWGTRSRRGGEREMSMRWKATIKQQLKNIFPIESFRFCAISYSIEWSQSSHHFEI